MIKIVDNDIFRGGQKIGWIEGNDIWGNSGKLGYFLDNDIYNKAGKKIGYLEGNYLITIEGKKIRLDENRRIITGGTISDLARAAIRLLLGE